MTSNGVLIYWTYFQRVLRIPHLYINSSTVVTYGLGLEEVVEELPSNVIISCVRDTARL